MHWIDWVVLIAFLGYTIWDGTRRGKDSENIEGYLLAGRGIPWWAAGLSIMATQASAITFIGTTGIAYTEDMRFVQVYLAIPFAMILISMFLVPFFSKMKAFTAYEVLEERFGLKTRLTTSALFLISRGLALGTVIEYPFLCIGTFTESSAQYYHHYNWSNCHHLYHDWGNGWCYFYRCKTNGCDDVRAHLLLCVDSAQSTGGSWFW